MREKHEQFLNLFSILVTKNTTVHVDLIVHHMHETKNVRVKQENK